MSFCKFSSDKALDSYTLVDNSFITEYLPYATEDAIKVYLLGLHFCGLKQASKEDFLRVLPMSDDRLVNAFLYWEEAGLLTIYSRNPLEICYLNNGLADITLTKFKKEEFADFNRQIEDIFQGREISQTEYLRYYEFIKETKIEQEAFLMIASYCAKIKGSGIRHPYILAVAKDWVANGALSVEGVEEILSRYEANTEMMRKIFAALGKKSTPEYDDKQQLIKWQDSWGFDTESIIYAATLCKKKGGIEKLDKILDGFYRNGIFTIEEMKEHTEHKQFLFDLTKELTNGLGLYYGSLDSIIENYTSKWCAKGFSDAALKLIAKFCLKRSIRTIEGMGEVVAKFYKDGLLTVENINLYIADSLKINSRIKGIIESTGSDRPVTDNDRFFYKTWSNVWKISEDIITYGASLAKDKPYSFSYLNKIFAMWKEKGITTLNEAVACPPPASFDSASKPAPAAQKTGTEHNYSKAELDAVFYELDDITKWEV